MKKWPQPGSMVHYAALGIELAAVLCVCLAIGWFIDRWRGGGVAFTLVGAVLGLAAGSYRMYRVARTLHRELKDDDEPDA